MSEGITANQLADGVVAFYKARLEYDNAQIVALLAGGAEELLPAPGGGRTYGVLAVICTADCSAGAYTFTGTPLIQIFCDGGTGALLGGTIAEDAADAYPLFSNGGNEKITASLRGKWSDGGDGSTTSGYENKALQLAFLGPATGISGGHANNTLKVTVLYTIIDV